MKRFFYTDPLAAAWMHMEHGFEYRGIHHLFANAHYPEDAISAQDLGDLIESYVLDGASDSKIYVHPDSLHLLEPKPGDAVEFDRWHWDRQRHEDMKNAPYKPHYGSVIECGKGEWLEVVSAGVGWDTTFGGHPFAMRHKIIQRSGLPFHWPESEST